MNSVNLNPRTLPTVFRGCMWDDGWEFDAPCIIYSPCHRSGIGGNSGHIDSMVEDYCIDICIDGKVPEPGLSEGDIKEFAWRGWSIRNMYRRRRAWHVKIRVRWFTDSEGLQFEVVSRKETFGKRPK